MEILIKASQFLLSLSLLIVLHELGHFLPAKWFKTKVEKFYLFFDYKGSLFKKKIGETEYGIGWIPLGGYVKIAGMIDESMDKEQMAKPPQPWEFRSKPAWQRLIIMLGGVFVNFVLGWAIYIGITAYWGDVFVKSEGVKNGFAVAEFLKPYGFKNGDKILKVNGEELENVMDINKLLFMRDVTTVAVLHDNGTQETLNIPENIGSIIWTNGDLAPFSERVYSPVIDSVIPKTAAFKAGVQPGDLITSVDGKSLQYWSEFKKLLNTTDSTMTLGVKRNGELKNLNITFDKENEAKVIGVSIKATEEAYRDAITSYKKDYSLGEAVTVGTNKAYFTLRDYIAQFKYVFTKKGATSLGGFISIGKIFPSSWNWKAFWGITAFLSIMLGFMNLLPIPALDGGHVLFTLWEMITGKKPSDKFLEYAQVTGFIILVALLLFANGNDIFRLFK